MIDCWCVLWCVFFFTAVFFEAPLYVFTYTYNSTYNYTLQVLYTTYTPPHERRKSAVVAFPKKEPKQQPAQRNAKLCIYSVHSIFYIYSLLYWHCARRPRVVIFFIIIKCTLLISTASSTVLFIIINKVSTVRRNR
jgi:hypothetical protein